MSALIECIPNVSEGRRDDVVSSLCSAALAAAPGVLLLDRTSDRDHNRSVLTFLGDGTALVRAMTALVGAALEAIDLRSHQGAHPRLGAVDVIPFVPLRGATSADCVALAKELGATLAARFALPVYL
jgi:glutamate formiminotransferase